MIIVEGIRIWSYSKVYNAIGEAAYDGINSQYLYSDKLVSGLLGSELMVDRRYCHSLRLLCLLLML